MQPIIYISANWLGAAAAAIADDGGGGSYSFSAVCSVLEAIFNF